MRSIRPFKRGFHSIVLTRLRSSPYSSDFFSLSLRFRDFRGPTAGKEGEEFLSLSLLFFYFFSLDDRFLQFLLSLVVVLSSHTCVPSLSHPPPIDHDSYTAIRLGGEFSTIPKSVQVRNAPVIIRDAFRCQQVSRFVPHSPPPQLSSSSPPPPFQTRSRNAIEKNNTT